MFDHLTNQGAARLALLCLDTDLRSVVNGDRLLVVQAGRIFCTACCHPVGYKAHLPVFRLACRGWGMRWRVLCSKLRNLVYSSYWLFVHNVVCFKVKGLSVIDRRREIILYSKVSVYCFVDTLPVVAPAGEALFPTDEKVPKKSALTLFALRVPGHCICKLLTS